MMGPELQMIIKEWNSDQITSYIKQLEERVLDMNALIKELKLLRRKKFGRKPLDTGVRGGK
jgi:hypothetical protein